MKNHKELVVWQRSMQLVDEVYKLIKSLPKEEQYALSNQIRRAAISIPSNIAEGNARESEKDFVRFLSIAQGSNAELETQLLLCRRLGYIDSDQLSNTIALSEEVAKMLRSLIKRLKTIEYNKGVKANS